MGKGTKTSVNHLDCREDLPFLTNFYGLLENAAK